MQVLIQRVREARVDVAGQTVGQIAQGLLVLVCAEPGDTVQVADKMLDKILKLRIFSDASGRMNLSVQDVQGGLLLVSQFTLAADLSSGNRPSFTAAAEPALARSLYEHMVAQARLKHASVATGEFAADMQVALVNDGPVTIPLRMPAA
ncbi:D-tyrosyl-tRNA(Tyr) deacylase [Lampropedia aestuarii]|uniref:D-aminoacyl-tRNA deacylase n=1 Tax=Lampropedia aestuarii TaxID=2562762 RepID=A0A4S5BHK6_9BURK|nr:D-aminoacyl-tRNA deacylase [Lampropedia aestuarii]MDH5857294.1 D-aminoacyl-tRNA deacylase [Lampropedia aestuarii]THJ31867.1 D-tyrosyl-tRNA(Tyr) deacylase [Lampropedia aestuarii]